MNYVRGQKGSPQFYFLFS